MNRTGLALMGTLALVVLCGICGFSQSPLRIPLGTNVVSAVTMNALTLQPPPIQLTGGQDSDVPFTVYFKRSVSAGASDSDVSIRFDVQVTVVLRASDIAAVAGTSLAGYDDLSTKAKMQASSALGLQTGLPALSAALSALYTGTGSDGVRVSALGHAPPAAQGASIRVVASDTSYDGDSVDLVIPADMEARASALLRSRKTGRP